MAWSHQTVHPALDPTRLLTGIWHGMQLAPRRSRHHTAARQWSGDRPRPTRAAWLL